MLTATQLLRVAEAYAEFTGMSLAQVGIKSCNNDKVFKRLAAGRGANILTVERATVWFRENWPPKMPWPVGVPRRRSAACGFDVGSADQP